MMLLFVFNFAGAKPQNEKQQAKAKAIEAVKMLDVLQYDKAIKLLQDALKLDPLNEKIVYQLGLTYYQKTDYNNAAVVFTKLLKMKNVEDEYYKSYVNVLMDANRLKEAFIAIEAGLKKFPNSSILYLELGNYYGIQKKYNEAITAYENGIESNPMLASNYYHAAKLYCYSNEEVWGMIYGEIFMNLEKNTKRTFEISKLLYNTYLSEIKFTSDSTTAVSFTRNSNSKNLEQLGLNIYEPTLMQSMIGTKSININTLSKIRTRFIEIYFESNYQKKFNNVLFNFQKEIKDAGHADAYSHWLLNKGNETDFSIWQLKNKEKWEKFIEWYKTHSLVITNENKFVRTKY
jgi:tetratricopeptide (TPR) repeat protein